MNNNEAAKCNSIRTKKMKLFRRKERAGQLDRDGAVITVPKRVFWLMKIRFTNN
jgi:hypothetical protein